MSILDLSRALRKGPSTLEEVLRRGESKIIKNHVNHKAKVHPEETAKDKPAP
jgi:predicted DNA binding protein